MKFSPGILLRKTSLVDYPGRVSSVLFLPGCNLRCPWCHNPALVLGGVDGLVSADDALAHLLKRRSVLGGVVLSGGEPCLHGELPDLVAEIKKLGLRIKLDTNGMFPAVLRKLFGREETRPDHIALDLKIAPARYAELTPINTSRKVAKLAEEDSRISTTNQHEPIRTTEELQSTDSLCSGGLWLKNGDPGGALIQSAALIRESGISHEYRTLALPGDFIAKEDVEALAPLADSAPWYFRPFRGGNCLDPSWDAFGETAPQERLRALAETLAGRAAELGKNGIVR